MFCRKFYKRFTDGRRKKTHGTRCFFAARLHKISACEKLWKSHSIWKAGFQHFPQSYQQGVWENSGAAYVNLRAARNITERIGEFCRSGAWKIEEKVNNYSVTIEKSTSRRKTVEKCRQLRYSIWY